MRVLVSSALGRQAVAAHESYWARVVHALRNELWILWVAHGGGVDEAADAYLRSYPVTDILLAAARAAAAAGEEPPCLQHLLRGLKEASEDPLVMEGQHPGFSAVPAQLRWLICQSCSIAGSYRAGQMALVALKPALVQLLQQLPPGEDPAVLESVLAAAEAAVQDVRDELQQAQMAVQQACRDAAETHIPCRAAVRQLALFDACMQRVATKEARAAQLEQHLQRATACADNV
uniref:Uncharacterized protein n=1 Tax=Tetradesmus obliquus TaxID=3088 RepID=A0A383V6Z5_TETOB|eukprot:jgi/Sobl393_1/6475/SZX61365.1